MKITIRSAEIGMIDDWLRCSACSLPDKEHAQLGTPTTPRGWRSVRKLKLLNNNGEPLGGKHATI